LIGSSIIEAITHSIVLLCAPWKRTKVVMANAIAKCWISEFAVNPMRLPITISPSDHPLTVWASINLHKDL
jgi:hypothetical protein